MMKKLLMLGLSLFATIAEGAPPGFPGDALAAALAYGTDDLGAKSACLSLDTLPSLPKAMKDSDTLRELEGVTGTAAAAVEGEPWSEQRTRSSLRKVIASGQMRAMSGSCDATIRIEAPRVVGNRVAVRVAVLYKAAGSRERGYLFAQTGDRYNLVAKTSEHVLVN